MDNKYLKPDTGVDHSSDEGGVIKKQGWLYHDLDREKEGNFVKKMEFSIRTPPIPTGYAECRIGCGLQDGHEYFFSKGVSIILDWPINDNRWTLSLECYGGEYPAGEFSTIDLLPGELAEGVIEYTSDSKTGDYYWFLTLKSNIRKFQTAYKIDDAPGKWMTSVIGARIGCNSCDEIPDYFQADFINLKMTLNDDTILSWDKEDFWTEEMILDECFRIDSIISIISREDSRLRISKKTT